MGHVVIQMGHVPRTQGKTGTQGEQDFARGAAGHAAGRLGWDGHVATVIGADDPVPRSDVFVAIHCDGSNSPQASGASVGYRNAEGARIASAWKAAYQQLGWSRGFRADNYTKALAEYYGTGRAARAGTPFAFILEAGFLTNPADRALLANADGHVRCAEAIRQAVRAVLQDGRDDWRTHPQLKRGAKGPWVVHMQQLLVRAGHDLSQEGGADGAFGPGTTRELVAYQAHRGLSADGICGPRTWERLHS